MADEKPPASGAATSGQADWRRPAPTIDLKATEIAGESASGSGDADAAAASADRKFMAWLPSHLFWPLVGAGAVLTLGIVLIVGLFSGGAGGAGDRDARVAQLEQQVRELAKAPVGAPPAANPDAQAVGNLIERLAKLEAAFAAVPAPASDPALADRLAALEAQLKSLSGSVAAFDTRNNELAAAAREARQRADANAAALAALTEKLAQPATSGGALDGQTSEVIAALAKRVAALESGAKTFALELSGRANARADDRPARAAAVALALAQAVERGQPFAAELAAAKTLASDPAVLMPLDDFATSGVPSAIALDHELSRLEPALLQAAQPAAHDSGILGKLQTNAGRLIRIRPIEEVSGDDPAAVIARVEVKSMRGDLTGALAELVKLPADVLAPAQPWIAKARARAAALEATHRFAADTLAALGRPSP